MHTVITLGGALHLASETFLPTLCGMLGRTPKILPVSEGTRVWTGRHKRPLRPILWSHVEVSRCEYRNANGPIKQHADVRIPCAVGRPGADPTTGRAVPPLQPRDLAAVWIIKHHSDLPKSTCFCLKPHTFAAVIRQNPFHAGKAQV